MMCSSWKISVFGILVLMLAFGMTTDVLAVNGAVTVSVTGADALRATEDATITFTVQATTAPDGDQDKAGAVSITIPAGWSRPIHISGEGDTPDGTIDATDLNDAGEVFITNAAGATGRISGRSLIATFGKDSTETVTFAYRSKNPRHAATYGFALSTQYHDITDGAADAINKRGGRFYLDIAVGSVPSGVGTFSITGLSGVYKHPDVDPKSEKDKYFLTSKQSIAGLNFTFKAEGTMLKNSTISINAGDSGGWGGFYPGPAGSSAGKVTVSGTGFALDESTSTATKVVVNITADRIEYGAVANIRIAGLEAPEIKGATPFNIRTFTPATSSRVAVDTSVGEQVKDPFTFITTAAPGNGKVVLSTADATGDPPTTGRNPLVYATSEEVLGNLVFTFTELEGLYGATTGKVQIEVPEGFTPEPLKAFGTATTAGTVSNADFRTATDAAPGLGLNGRTITVTFNTAADITTGGGTVTYNGDIKAPKAEGVYKFTTRTMTGPHGAMAEIGASPMIEVIGGHGKGTMMLTQNGQPFTQTASEAEVGNLVFTYTPGGRMAVGAVIQVKAPDTPPLWSLFRADNGDGVADRGEVSLAGDKATLAVNINGNMFTATTTKVLTPNDNLVFTYKNVKVPKAGPRSDTFTTATQSRAANDGETLVPAEIGASPNVGIGRAADGTGSLAVNVTQADAGSTIGDLVFTFTAAGKMSVGSVIEVTIPNSGGWPAPGTDVSQPGGVVLGDTIAASLATTATTMSATIATELNAGENIVFTYKNITAPTTGGQYTFSGKSTSSAIGNLQPLAAGVTISIDEVAAGSIMLSDAAGMFKSASPGMASGDLAFTFTAGAQMAQGAQVQITIPTGWSAPFLDNNDGSDSSGEVSIAGAAYLDVSGGGAQPWVLTATTTATLEIGNTLVVAYKQVTAPAAEATYTFMVKSSVASDGTLLPLSSQPNVIVRTPVAAIAVHAMPTSVFAGEDVAITVDLWSAASELAKALGSMVVMLDDGGAGGSFSDADGNTVTSVTIADNTSSAMATYMNGTAGMVTITATSGEMTATVDVEVKSTVRGLSVDNQLVKQGSTIMISAIGQAGGGTVVVLDSDGDKVGTKKALDPVGEPDADGDQEYERSITLPAVLEDGMYTVSVEIQGDVNNDLQIEVVNDQTPPSVTNATASQEVVVGRDTLTITADVAMNESMVEIASVVADLGGLDSSQESVMLDELSSSPGRYFTIITVTSEEAGNTAEDGEYTITITATDAIGNMGSDTTMVTLENDPSELTRVWVEPDAPYRPGETAWIKAMGSAGGSAMATVNDSESDMVIANVALEEMEGTPGTYVAGLTIVEDAHPVGSYNVTVTLGTKTMMSENMLTVIPAGYDFTLSIPAGTHLIHVPLNVTDVDGAEMPLETVGDLHAALGDAVNYIISLDADGNWNSYLGDMSAGSASDAMLGDDTGLIAVMNSAATLELTGTALGTGGVSAISLTMGNNLVGVPLDPAAGLDTISDALARPAVSAVVVSNAAGDGFQTVTRAGDSGDGAIMGGVGYIVQAAADASIPVVGAAWQNAGGSSSSAAPPVVLGVKTPVLQVQGKLIDEAGMMTRDGLNVSVRNLTSGSVLGSAVATDDYSMTFVKFDMSAAKVGDVLQISADSANPLLGIRPVQHVVTAEDVLSSQISLPDLVTYEIPAQTELLANYPNPFNPETWIPFRLAEDASVSLSIYGAHGSLVRSIDLGVTPAAVYEGRSDAIYWDGRNDFGEQVSSGIYFYHLRAGDFSATRKMVIVK